MAVSQGLSTLSLEPIVGREVSAENLLRNYGTEVAVSAVSEDLSMLSLEQIVGREVSGENLSGDYRRMFQEYYNVEGEYNWYHIHLNHRVFLTTSKFYEPTNQDEGKPLLLEYAGKPLFVTRPVISSGQSLLHRPRQMINLTNNNAGPSLASNKTDQLFTVVTYNVLADVSATYGQYPHCPSFALRWEHRRKKLLKEIIQQDPDIICLQEVQGNHFTDFFNPELTRLGYDGGQMEKQRGVCASPTDDGCATFYKLDKFDFIRSNCIDLSGYDKLLPEEIRSGFRKDNIALNVVLSLKTTGQRLCIANTHIHAKRGDSDVKLWQIWYLLHILEGIVKENDQAPLVICGDFNSLPGSAPHSLLTQGHVNPSHQDFAYDPCSTLQSFQRFQHSLGLASAYSSYFHCDVDNEHIGRTMNANTKEPYFTNFAPLFPATLDYIFHTKNLKVASLLELMDE